MFHLDSAIYGNPNYGLSQTQQNQFIRGAANDVGRGLYKWLNPTAPLPVQLTWNMKGATLSSFRGSWENPAELCYGANWFTLDLPLMLDDSKDGVSTDYDAVTKTFRTRILIGDDTTSVVGYDFYTGTGSIYNSTPAGMFVDAFRTTYSGPSVHLQITDPWLPEGAFTQPADEPLDPRPQSRVFSKLPDGAGGVLDSVVVRVPAAAYEQTLNWSSIRYSQNTGASDLHAFFLANVGQEVDIEVDYGVSRYQRYRCHFRQPFQASLIGYDYWSVSALIEVDASEPIGRVAV